jgi:hypothetical protein
MILTTLTWRQLGYWENGITLFSHALAVASDNYPVQVSLRVTLAQKGRLDETILNFKEALSI